MRRLLTLVPLAICTLTAQLREVRPAWKEFSIGPAASGPVGSGSPVSTTNNIRQGILHSRSITLKSLIEVATGVSWTRIEGPEWLDTEHYSLAAALSDESRLRLRTRSAEDVRIVDEFRGLLGEELARRFGLQFHKETRDASGYTMNAAEGGVKQLRPAKVVKERATLMLNRNGLTRNGTFEARNITFRGLGTWLQNQLKKPVVLGASMPAGNYDFHVTWKSGDTQSLLAALRNQLGVDVTEETRSAEFVVVDRAERPEVLDAPPATEPVVLVSTKLSSSQMREDFRVLRAALEEGHPGIYRYTPKAEMDQVFDRTAAQLLHSLTPLEFFRTIAPAVAAIKCGHTVLGTSSELQAQVVAEPLIPIEAAVVGGKVYVARDFRSEPRLAGAEILSINDVPAAKLLANMLRYLHGDGDSSTAGPYQLSHNVSFARNLYLLAGVRSPFRVQYALGRKRAEMLLEGMPMKRMRNTADRPPAATWRLLNDAAGVLKINEFDGAAEGGVPLREFFERVFAEVQEKHVNNLILDVRGNGGGEDELGRRLFAYFAEAPFTYYRDLILNKLDFRFLRYVPGGEPLPPSIRALIHAGADGKFHATGHPNWGIQQPAAPHFSGKAMVLMNGGSFSTTCEFVAMLHARGGATFIGEETAGGYYGNTSGAAATVRLPSSKLMLPVQLAAYYMAIEGKAHGSHGIEPDHGVADSIEDMLAGRDRAMEMALGLVRAEPIIQQRNKQ